MDEAFLHYVWQQKRFDLKKLATTDGQPVTVIHPGRLNRDAGPDFLEARVKIGETEWAGHIEIHYKASEWYHHKHEVDPAYRNVILHVVYSADKEVSHEAGPTIPTLKLADRMDVEAYHQYTAMLKTKDWIPCASVIHRVESFRLEHWLERMTIERLQTKSEILDTLLTETKNNWEETFYRVLANSFGLKVNSHPFAWLARETPLKILAKHKNNLTQIEALLFGQAGLLAGVFTDAYPQKLQDEYAFLRRKYGLQPIPGSVWKFLRLRPANFPTIRLAQLAALIHQSTHLFSKILESKNLKELRELFSTEPSAYWEHHYQFDKRSKKKSKALGKTAIDLLLINTVIPTVFHYSKLRDEPIFQDKALAWLSELPPEKNHIQREWEKLLGKAQDAGKTQGLHHLKKTYCDQKRCLECGIGHQVLNRS